MLFSLHVVCKQTSGPYELAAADAELSLGIHLPEGMSHNHQQAGI